jgi:ectoine hydroxylase-related dioxygenase (phytanoyl-CoA dioxygenase family)
VSTILEDQVAEFKETGYVLLPNAVDAAYLRELQAVTESVLTEERFRRSGGRNLLAIDAVFEVMIDGHAAMPLLEALIPDLQLLAMDIRTCPPRGGSMAWHTDFGYFCDRPISINTALYLDDLTPHNGALRVLPRSHKTPFSLKPDQLDNELPGEVKVICPAGTMVVFSDQLWHRTGTNETDRQRRGIFTYYGPFWMKQCCYETLPEPLHRMHQYIEGKDARRKQLMGYYREGAECNPSETYEDRRDAGTPIDTRWNTTVTEPV